MSAGDPPQTKTDFEIPTGPRALTNLAKKKNGEIWISSFFRKPCFWAVSLIQLKIHWSFLWGTCCGWKLWDLPSLLVSAPGQPAIYFFWNLNFKNVNLGSASDQTVAKAVFDDGECLHTTSLYTWASFWVLKPSRSIVSKRASFLGGKDRSCCERKSTW